MVVDSNVLVIALLDESKLNPGEKPHRPSAVELVRGLKDRQYTAHLPRIAVVEICSALRRRAGEAPAIATRDVLRLWESNGLIVLYDLDDTEMERCVDAVMEYSLRGADALFAALANRTNLSLRTVDRDILKKFSKASLP